MRLGAVWYPLSKWQEAKAFYGSVLGLAQTHCNDNLGWAAFAAAVHRPAAGFGRPAGRGGRYLPARRP
jgi:predicted enzyme related to lactoylglutathione lyase